jgi:hypothetical protein
MIRRPPTSIAVQQSEVEELKAERIDAHNHRPAEHYTVGRGDEVKTERSGTGVEEQDQESYLPGDSIADTR